MARVGVLIADAFEDVEYRVFVDRLREAGDEVIVLGIRKGLPIQGRCGQETAFIEASYSDFFPEQFHGLVIPGGPSTDSLCADDRAVLFVRLFFQTGRPLAALGDAPELFLAARVAAGCTVTSTPVLGPRFEEAGARWLDQRVVVSEHGHIVTGQAPSDVNELVEAFVSCLRGTEAHTCPRETPHEVPPLDYRNER